MKQPTNPHASTTVRRARAAVLLFAAAVAVAAAIFGVSTSPGRHESAGFTTSPGRGHFAATQGLNMTRGLR